MAAVQEPEIQFAQRLASNEKPVRTKTIKKLRKYINVRSQRETGGFTGDELLKLWKGLFYCLWMQDKPLLQEELSNQISGLINSFHHIDGQFLYLESFLQTFKREWTGIDRLRMDKFFQLVRFMFRQTFELLKKKDWDSSVVSRFLELLTAQLLQSGCEAPSGLQFHILDLYMTELAAVGSTELSADQNLTFIEPFCKAAAKTKDRILFRAICNSIFSTIIDQAPFAIEDLMKEMKAVEDSDSDSGQASEEEEVEEVEKWKPVSKKGKQINGKLEDMEDDDDDDDEDEDDEELHLEDSDSEMQSDKDMGPVLQFDYAALADRLFTLASRSNTPSHNRQRLYKIIKVLRDLGEGVFPQDEYPEEVSTDEDDDYFGSRKRLKRRQRKGEEEGDEEGGAPAAKKKKGKKKEAPKQEEPNKDSVKDESGAADVTSNDGKKKKKKRRKKKKKAMQVSGAEAGENTKPSEEEQTVAQDQGASEEAGGGDMEKPQEGEKEKQTSSVKVSERNSETLLLIETQKQPSVTVTEETSQQSPNCEEQPEKTQKSKKKKQKPEAAEELQIHQSSEPEVSTEGAVPEKKKKGPQTQREEAEAEEAEIIMKTSETETETPTKKKKKKKGSKAESGGESQVDGASTETDLLAAPCEENGTIINESTAAAKRKKKKKNLQPAGDEEAPQEEAAAEDVNEKINGEIVLGDETGAQLKKKTKKKEAATAEAAQESSATPLKKRRKNNEEAAVEEEGGAAVADITPAKKKKKSGKQAAAAQADEIKDPSGTQVVHSGDAEPPPGESEVLSSSSSAKKKKRKIPVVFEFEADELEAAASINGLAVEETNGGSAVEEPSTPLTGKKLKKKVKTPSGSEFVRFQTKAAIPTPLFCKTKGGLGTPQSSKKKSQTPKSESKKVTFGLKNNKTAEFRKTDRSLLVSPDGSSRVPFDPEQKPKFGVLKSPPTPLSFKGKKTPTSIKKTLKSPNPFQKSTPKRRPSAADFF